LADVQPEDGRILSVYGLRPFLPRANEYRRGDKGAKTSGFPEVWLHAFRLLGKDFGPLQ
jgi:hypothetical protein